MKSFLASELFIVLESVCVIYCYRSNLNYYNNAVRIVIIIIVTQLFAQLEIFVFLLERPMSTSWEKPDMMKVTITRIDYQQGEWRCVSMDDTAPCVTLTGITVLRL